MKKLLLLIRNLFNNTPNSRRFRKLKGGKWYKVCDVYGQSGMASPTPYWTQEKPAEESGIAILKKEKYSSPIKPETSFDTISDDWLDRQL